MLMETYKCSFLLFLDLNNMNNSSITSFVFEGGTNLFKHFMSIPLDVLTYFTHKNKNVWFADFALASSIT